MNIIALGMGVQSTALYYMSSIGELPRADYAVFSDLGREGCGTYKYLKFLQGWAKQNNGIPLIIRRDKNLFKDLLKANNSTGQRFASIPAFTKNVDGTTGMLRRQCTAEYKIQVVNNAIRDLYGLKSKQRRPKTKVWQGITLDELERMSIPQETWKENVYPFIGYSVNNKGVSSKIDWTVPRSRANVYSWYDEHNLPIPPKSACVFCPYQSDARWYDMKMNQPKDFNAAVKADKAIRDSSKRGLESPIYLHSSCKPLDEIVFSKNSEFEWGECSGNCHI